MNNHGGVTTKGAKERPILFSGAMVRAVLDGRKSQTRRAVKWPAVPDGHDYDYEPCVLHDGWPHLQFNPGDGLASEQSVPCPYGLPGDRLWVKETHRNNGENVVFRAGGELDVIPMELSAGMMPESDKWRPSIFLPRWASRILLEVVAVRVERLQEISEADAWAEGCKRGEPTDNGGFFPAEEIVSEGHSIGWDCPRDWYADLWEKINGEGSWDLNPWVWVVEFRRVNESEVRG